GAGIRRSKPPPPGTPIGSPPAASALLATNSRHPLGAFRRQVGILPAHLFEWKGGASRRPRVVAGLAPWREAAAPCSGGRGYVEGWGTRGAGARGRLPPRAGAERGVSGRAPGLPQNGVRNPHFFGLRARPG